MEMFSDIVCDKERGFNDRKNAAEFLMKYHFVNSDDENEGRVVIVDDIGGR